MNHILANIISKLIPEIKLIRFAQKHTKVTAFFSRSRDSKERGYFLRPIYGIKVSFVLGRESVWRRGVMGGWMQGR